MTVVAEAQGNADSVHRDLAACVGEEVWARIHVQRVRAGGGAQPEVSLLLPTRERPALLRRFLKSAAQHALHPERVEVVLYVDDDDAGAFDISAAPFHTTLLRGPRFSMSAYNSLCAAHSSGGLLMAVNDDVVVESAGWDAAIGALSNLHPDGIFLAWPRDGVMNQRLSTFPIVSRRLCRLLGDPFGSAYRRFFIDSHLLDIFLRLRHLGHDRLHYLPQVIFRHGRDVAPPERRMDLGDDDEFVRQAPVRQWQARRLVAAASGGRCAAPRPAPADSDSPGTSWQALQLYSRAFLLDGGLPLGRRAAYWSRFYGHYTMTRTPVGDWLSGARGPGSVGT